MWQAHYVCVDLIALSSLCDVRQAARSFSWKDQAAWQKPRMWKAVCADLRVLAGRQKAGASDPQCGSEAPLGKASQNVAIPWFGDLDCVSRMCYFSTHFS